MSPIRCPSSATDNAHAHAEIEADKAAYFAKLKTGDVVGAVKSFYSEMATLGTNGRDFIIGHAAIAEFVQSWYTPDVQFVDDEADTMAFTDTFAQQIGHMRVAAADGTTVAKYWLVIVLLLIICCRYTATYEKQDGHWKLLIDTSGQMP